MRFHQSPHFSASSAAAQFRGGGEGGDGAAPSG